MGSAPERYRLLCRAIEVPPLPSLLDYGETHASRRTFDGADRRRQILRGQIRELRAGDLFDLSLGHLADHLLSRLPGSLFQARGALEEHGSRRRLGDEGEGAIRVDG